MAGDPERSLERLEPALAQKTFAQDQKGPAITDNGNGAGHRARLFLKRIPLHQLLQSPRRARPLDIHSNSELMVVQSVVFKISAAESTNRLTVLKKNYNNTGTI